MTENKPKPGNSDIPASLAAAVVACVALRDLVRIRQLYPNALSDDDADELHQSLVERFRAALGDKRFDDIREKLYRETELDAPSADVELSVLFTVLVAQCPNVQITEDDADATRESITAAISACQERVSSPLKDILSQLVEIKLYDCRIPEGSPGFSDPRRSMQLLRSYWSLCRSIVIHQIDACIGFHPHPLFRLIVNLRSRIETYFEHLADFKGAKEANEALGSLLDVILSSEPDDLSAVPEYTHQLVQTVDAFLESARLETGSKIFPLTHAEEIFLAHAGEAIEHYHKHVDSTWARMVQKTSNRQVEQHRPIKTGRSSSISSPAMPGATWADLNTKPANGHTVTRGNPILQVYCCSITQEGTHPRNKAEYERLVKSREDYDIFIDGMTRDASCRDGSGKLCVARLTARELAILGDYIQAGKPMRPYRTDTGRESSSPEAARKLFEEARRKVDVKLHGRYGYRAFHLHRHPTNKKLHSFEFRPPDDLTYCLILPV
jgi:hypothetical protein